MMRINAERRERDIPIPERKPGDESGPPKRDVKKPGGNNELLRRMRKVDPDQAKKYRQRSGQ
ncbi:MAG: ubiquitin-like protein UBact [Fimbriimonadales bacterium]|nr:ubiquitin-like protein UBact [Fimbriimonadales bacterium]